MWSTSSQTNTTLRLVRFPISKHVAKNRAEVVVDMSWHKDIKNTGKDAEVYAPQSGPNGLIEVNVARSNKPSRL